MPRKQGVPWVKGFKPPTDKASQVAIRINPLKSEELEPALVPDKSHFGPLPKPESIDDWLAQYVEEGQTVTQFVTHSPWLSSRPRKGIGRESFVPTGRAMPEKYPNHKIYLVQLGDFPSGCPLRVEALRQYVEAFWQLPCRLLPPIHVRPPKHNGTARADDSTNPCMTSIQSGGKTSMEFVGKSGKAQTLRCSDCAEFEDTDTTLIELKMSDLALSTPSHTRHEASGKEVHRQLEISCVLSLLKGELPTDAICLVAVTLEDLFDTKPDLFVAGYAHGGSRVACFSFFRYNPALRFSPEFWWSFTQGAGIQSDGGRGNGKEQVKGNGTAEGSDGVQLLARSCKILVHEIGHLLGVDHCIHFRCCMNGSGHLLEDFRQPAHMCPVDLRKLQLLTGADLTKRYHVLLDFYQREGMTEEAAWVQSRLKLIEEKTKSGEEHERSDDSDCVIVGEERGAEGSAGDKRGLDAPEGQGRVKRRRGG